MVSLRFFVCGSRFLNLAQVSWLANWKSNNQYLLVTFNMPGDVMIQIIFGEFLSERQAAALLDISPGTLSVWRSTGRYCIPFVKIGRKVRYRKSDLDAWIESRTRKSGATS